MCRKVDELCRELTAVELDALGALGQATGKAGRTLPFPLTQRLMNLGLVELCCGGLDLTVAGRLVLASMQPHQPRYEQTGIA